MSTRKGHDAPDFATVIPVVRGALALAATFFPQLDAEGRTYISMDDALFFLSGHMDKWSRWPGLSSDDKKLIARLLRWRPVEVANRTVFKELLAILLADHIHDFRAIDGERILAELSRPAKVVADECAQQLWLEQQAKPRRPTRIANHGEFVTWIRHGPKGSGSARTSYSLNIDPETEPEFPIDLGPAACADELDVSVAQLASIAARLDTALGQQHRSESVERLFGRLRSADNMAHLTTLTLHAGATRILNAPTGVGKNVLAELLACWCAGRKQVTTLLVGNNAVVVRTAAAIERSLQKLDIDADVVPLMSPDSIQREAETAATGTDSSSFGSWAFSRLAYGCAIPAASHADQAIDTWKPGEEPCTDMRQVKEDGTISTARRTCPFKPTCGKFRQARRACRSRIIVTSHANFYAGRLHVPVLINGRTEEKPSVEEVLLHRSHLIIIDEIDEFQARLISHSAHHLELATRRSRQVSPLRRFDMEFNGALGRMGVRLEGRVHASLTQARYMAENYNRHLSAGHFHVGRAESHPLFERWLLPRRWDAWLAAVLFNLPEEQRPSSSHVDVLQGMFPMGDSPVLLPEWLEPVAEVLLLLITPSAGGDLFDNAWDEIFGLLTKHPYDDCKLDDNNVRAAVTDRLIRRAYLEPLRKLLFDLVHAAPELRASGIDAATEISDALRQFGIWRAAPNGPLGRVLFAFTELYDSERPKETGLRVSGFGGDPHVYVSGLGDLTALAHTGHPRVVLGLSATGYFPGAPHHHVQVRPSWWVSDEEVGGVTIRAAPVSDEEQQLLRISGTSGFERTKNLVKLGRLLWLKHLAPELRALETDQATAHKARLLLAVTSYDSGYDLAAGIAAAGVPADRIVLAVRPKAGADITLTPCGTELPADRLEEFGHTVGQASGSVLIAPLARAERGLNFVDDAGRPLIGSVWMVVRPIPVMDDPAQILAHVNSRSHTEATPTDDPAGVLNLMWIAAGKHYDELFTSLPYFRTLPDETQLAIACEILNGLIQLAGRARRGGETADISLVDYAFYDTSGKSDLPTLIQRLRTRWDRDGHLYLLESLYGETLKAIFRFADEGAPGL